MFSSAFPSHGAMTWSDFFGQQLNGLTHALLTAGHRSVEIRALDDDKVSAESKSSHDIGTGISRLSPR